MKQIIYFIISFSFALSFTSCDELKKLFQNNETQPEEGSYTASDYGTRENNDAMVQQVDSMKYSVANIEGDVKTLGEQLQNYKQELDDTGDKIEKLEKSKLDSRTLIVVSAILLLFSIIILWLLSRKMGLSKEEVEKIVKNESKSLSRSWSNLNNQEENNQMQRLGFRLNDLEKELRDTRSAIKSLMQNQEPTKPIMPQPHPAPEQPNPSGSSPQKFFLQQPTEDKAFLDSQKTTIQNEKCFYEFTLDQNNSKKATFVFKPFNTNRQSFAHDYSHQIILPACELIDNGTSTFDCTKGEAELKDGKWNVTKKAIVIFR